MEGTLESSDVLGNNGEKGKDGKVPQNSMPQGFRSYEHDTY
jgi:hypothetical protein